MPLPESEQVISEALKEHYMLVSKAPPQSGAQQKAVLRMARKASNGKELLLVMRAAVGVFPPGAGLQESELCSMVTARMMELGTLDQLLDYASRYSVDPASAVPYVHRMFQLGEGNSDPRVWRRIGLTASRLDLDDLARHAQAKVDQLAGRKAVPVANSDRVSGSPPGQ